MIIVYLCACFVVKSLISSCCCRYCLKNSQHQTKFYVMLLLSLAVKLMFFLALILLFVNRACNFGLVPRCNMVAMLSQQLM